MFEFRIQIVHTFKLIKEGENDNKHFQIILTIGLIKNKLTTYLIIYESS